MNSKSYTQQLLLTRFVSWMITVSIVKVQSLWHSYYKTKKIFLTVWEQCKTDTLGLIVDIFCTCILYVICLIQTWHKFCTERRYVWYSAVSADDTVDLVTAAASDHLLHTQLVSSMHYVANAAHTCITYTHSFNSTYYKLHSVIVFGACCCYVNATHAMLAKTIMIR